MVVDHNNTKTINNKPVNMIEKPSTNIERHQEEQQFLTSEYQNRKTSKSPPPEFSSLFENQRSCSVISNKNL